MLFGSMKLVKKSDYKITLVVNNGHLMEYNLACDLMNLGFTIDFENDKIRAVSTDRFRIMHLETAPIGEKTCHLQMLMM